MIRMPILQEIIERHVKISLRLDLSRSWVTHRCVIIAHENCRISSPGSRKWEETFCPIWVLLRQPSRFSFFSVRHGQVITNSGCNCKHSKKSQEEEKTGIADRKAQNAKKKENSTKREKEIEMNQKVQRKRKGKTQQARKRESQNLEKVNLTWKESKNTRKRRREKGRNRQEKRDGAPSPLPRYG